MTEREIRNAALEEAAQVCEPKPSGMRIWAWMRAVQPAGSARTRSAR
jgi:hypothetical protein